MRSFLIGLLLLCSKIIYSQIELIPTSDYVCVFTENQLLIDGKTNDLAWQSAEWTQPFVNINDIGIEPYLKTQVKMLWDDEFFYFYAQMEEPHIWANLKQRDTVIFYDNDIELFIDPNGDTHHYYELEINAFNTIWDLLLTKAYRDGGQAVNNWDINGIKSSVHIEGTLNDPSDTDEFWAVEVAVPWSVLEELNTKGKPPVVGETWRINYSRVQWETEIANDKYIKKKDPKTGKTLPENNWAWSRQRIIAMHEPEFWGRVVFSKSSADEVSFDAMSEEIRQVTYTIHRNQLKYHRDQKVYNDQKNDLLPIGQFSNGEAIEWSLEANKYMYHVIIRDPTYENIYWHIDQSGKNWKEIRP